jgi:hypothetical protein
VGPAGKFSCGAFEQVEGVGGGADEGVLIEDLFGQGADQGLAPQGPMMELLGAADDFVQVEGTFGLDKYINNNIYI